MERLGPPTAEAFCCEGNRRFSIKAILTFAIGAGMIALTACGGDGDDALGDNAADTAEAQADNLEAMADNATNEARSDALEDQADAVEEKGEAREEAIDNSDVDADAMTDARKEAAANAR